MDQSTLRQLTRRVAFALIVALQLGNFCLVMVYTWTPPRKRHPKMITMATFSQLVFIADFCFRVTERNMDVKLGRRLIQGLGIDALFWGIVVWSSGLVGMDVVSTPNGLLNWAQLFALDVITWTALLSSVMALVERSGKDESIVDEKGNELTVDVKRDEKVIEKEEV